MVEYLQTLGWGWWLVVLTIDGAISALRNYGPRWVKPYIPERAGWWVLVLVWLYAGQDAWRVQRDAANDWKTKHGDAQIVVARLEGEKSQLQQEVDRLRTVPEQQALDSLKDELSAEKAARQQLEDALETIRAATPPPPRVISDGEEERMTAWLRTTGQPTSVDIIYASPCDDCQRLASAYLRALLAADWNVPNFDMTMPTNTGVFLSSGLDDDDSFAQSVRGVFSGTTDIECGYSRHSGHGLKLIIGPRERP